MAQSVARATQIIDAIATQRQTVLQLAQAFGVHRSTMFRELQTLEMAGYVRKLGNGTYTLGFHFITLAQNALENLDLRDTAYVHVRRLHKIVGNTVHVAALMENTMVYVDKVEDANGVRMYSRVGALVRPHCSGVGKAILAGLSRDERDTILEGSQWERYTDATITTRAALDIELDRTAQQGWALDDGEFEDFVNCVAVPIRTAGGVVGALSVTALRMVQNLEQLKMHAPLMQRVAAEIASDLE